MDITFNWIGGATFILSIDNLKIAVDPVLCRKGTIQDFFWFKSKRLEDPIYNESDFDSIDLWLITHNHEDHLDSLGINKISKQSTVISNGNSKKHLVEAGIKNLSTLKWYEIKEFDINNYNIKIETIPAIHGINPISATLAGIVNGYYLTISKEGEKVTIYITGDTVYKKKTIKALRNKKIDLMIPNMGAAKEGSWIMTLTLNSKMLAKMIDVLNPKVVVPVHYGTFKHYMEPVNKIEEIQDERIKIVGVGSKTKVIFQSKV